MAIVNKCWLFLVFFLLPQTEYIPTPLEAYGRLVGEVACALFHHPCPGHNALSGSPHSPGLADTSNLPGDSRSYCREAGVASLLCDPVSLLLPKEEQSLPTVDG